MIKLLIAHNYYQQPGGEDQVFAAESDLLLESGHDVVRYTLRNDAVGRMNRMDLAARAVWNTQTYRELRSIIRRERPALVHFHNTLPLMSPAAYYAAKHEGIAVVQTLHNYRLICPNALLFRDGVVCERCLHKVFPWPGVQYACYRDSKQASAIVATVLATHRLARTWRDKVDVYIALTEFARDKFVEGGLPEEKIIVKPNFLQHDPLRGEGNGMFALFVGRLAPEKGVDVLLDAWEKLDGRIPLKILGDGPLAALVEEKAKHAPGVEWLGRRDHEEVIRLMKEAYVLVFPSVWYEGFPMTIVESFAVGLPVIASCLGSMATLIEHGRTGLHFTAGDSTALAEQVRWSFDHPSELQTMRVAARAEFDGKYDGRRNYDFLMSAYERAIAAASASHT